LICVDSNWFKLYCQADYFCDVMLLLEWVQLRYVWVVNLNAWTIWLYVCSVCLMVDLNIQRVYDAYQLESCWVEALRSLFWVNDLKANRITCEEFYRINLDSFESECCLMEPLSVCKAIWMRSYNSSWTCVEVIRPAWC